MDQVGYPGVDEHTFIDAANGETPPPPEGKERPGLTTDALGPTTTAGFGRMQREGQVSDKRRR